MAKRPWMDRVDDLVRTKLKLPAEFSCFYFEAVEAGFIVEGGIPRILTRGPRKGKRSWRDCKRDGKTIRCIISDDEVKTMKDEGGSE